MPWIWGSLFDCRLKAAVMIRVKKASVNPLKNDNYEKWTTAHVLFCLLSQHLVNYKQKITTSKSKASKTLGISFLHRTQWCNSTLKQSTVQWSVPQMVKDILAYPCLISVPVLSFIQFHRDVWLFLMDWLAKWDFWQALWKLHHTKENRDLLADPRNIQNKMVHHQEWPWPQKQCPILLAFLGQHGWFNWAKRCCFSAGLFASAVKPPWCT